MKHLGVAILATLCDKTDVALIYFAAIAGIIAGVLDELLRPPRK